MTDEFSERPPEIMCYISRTNYRVICGVCNVFGCHGFRCMYMHTLLLLWSPISVLFVVMATTTATTTAIYRCEYLWNPWRGPIFRILTTHVRIWWWWRLCRLRTGPIFTAVPLPIAYFCCSRGRVTFAISGCNPPAPIVHICARSYPTWPETRAPISDGRLQIRPTATTALRTLRYLKMLRLEMRVPPPTHDTRPPITRRIIIYCDACPRLNVLPGQNTTTTRSARPATTACGRPGVVRVFCSRPRSRSRGQYLRAPSHSPVPYSAPFGLRSLSVPARIRATAELLVPSFMRSGAYSLV